jgi:hypothetical protein
VSLSRCFTALGILSMQLYDAFSTRSWSQSPKEGGSCARMLCETLRILRRARSPNSKGSSTIRLEDRSTCHGSRGCHHCRADLKHQPNLTVFARNFMRGCPHLSQRRHLWQAPRDGWQPPVAEKEYLRALRRHGYKKAFGILAFTSKKNLHTLSRRPVVHHRAGPGIWKQRRGHLRALCFLLRAMDRINI